jgi:hypothetical protein
MFIFMFLCEFRDVLTLMDNFQDMDIDMDMDLSILTDIML